MFLLFDDARNAGIYSFVREGYRTAEEQQWNGLHCQERVANEPWHYRYVGKEAAETIHQSGMCLEEYIDTLD